MLFSGKTVVVTGASSGIGRALAVGFCSDGANVVGIGRTRGHVEEVARLCEHGRAHFAVGDIARPRDVESLFAEAIGRFGKVDILVNNAAVYPKAAFVDSPADDWARAIQTNVVGMAFCCRAALPGMLAQGFGRILNLGSLAWKNPIPNSSAYSASKAAVRVLTRALAMEVDRRRYPDVLINEFLPGSVRTGMSERGIDPAEVYPHARVVANLPRGGPTGVTFLQSTIYFENRGLRARLQRLIARALGRPVHDS
jgi:2-hydroxycyclohexanecarboxyl-CoA dehydrogenase